MSENAANFVRVNRLKEGWTCNVQVSSDDSSLESLQEAKDKALVIIRELNDALTPVVVESAADEEVPF